MPLRVGRLPLGVVLVTSFFVGSAARADEPTKQECVAANESAQDLTRAGKLREAREQLIRCTSKACPRAVRDDCADQLNTVEQAIPQIVFTPKGDSSIEPRSVNVAIDGVSLPNPLDGTALSVDPGDHTFTFTAGDRPPITMHIVLRRGQRLEHEVVFKPATVAEASPVEKSVEHRLSATRVIGWSSLGVGVGGIALGSIFGILAINDKSSLGKKCDGRECPPKEQTDMDALHFNGVAADISFGVGILGIAAGGALLLLVPDDTGGETPHDSKTGSQIRPWIGVGSIGMAGRFR